MKIHLSFVGIVFLVAIFIMLPNLGGSALLIPNNVLAWMISFIYIASVIFKTYTKGYFKIGRLFLPFFIIVVSVLSSYFLFESEINFVPEEGAALFGSLLIFFCISQIEDKELFFIRVFFILSLSGLIQTLIVYLQNQGISVCIGCTELKESLIYGGTFQQRNIMASYLAITVAASLILLSNFFKKTSKIFEIVALVNIFASTSLIVLSGSRVAWLAMLMILIILLLLNFKKAIHKPRVIFVLLLGSFSIVLYITNINISQKEVTSERVDVISSESINIRKVLYSQALDMIWERPIKGYGVDSFERTYVEFTANRHAIDENYPGPLGSRYDHVHNEIFQLWLERGILPILAIMMFLYVYLLNLLKLKYEHILIVLMLFLPFVHVITEYPLRQSVFHLLSFIIFLSFSEFVFGGVKKLNFRCKAVIFYPLYLIAATFIFLSCFIGLVQIRNTIVFTYFTANPIMFFDAFQNSKFDFFSHYKVQMYKYHLIFIHGTQTPDPNAIKEYIVWAKDFVKIKPRQEIYENLINGLVILDRVDEAKIVYDEAFYFYPTLDFLEPK